MKSHRASKRRDAGSPRVGVYVRTSVLTREFDSDRSELLQYCKSNGWFKVQIYHDRTGGMIDAGDLNELEGTLKRGILDEELIGRLVKQEGQDEVHRRDAMTRLLHDARSGRLDVVLAKDFGRLGGNRLELFEVLDVLLQSRVRLIIPSVGHVTAETRIPPTAMLDFR
jgi:DNA invertase Pin-like site-specific DNA recombinase